MHDVYVYTSDLVCVHYIHVLKPRMQKFVFCIRKKKTFVFCTSEKCCMLFAKYHCVDTMYYETLQTYF